MKKALLLSAAMLVAAWTFRPEPVSSHAVVTTTVTFDREIVRILQKKCIACHSQRNIGMPLTSYEETRPWAGSIHEEVLRKHMPPWRAVAGYGEFANDAALTSRELQFITAWIDGNGPKTKDQRLVVNVDEGSTAESDRLRPDFSRWQLGKPNVMKLVPPTPVAPGSGDMVTRVVIDLGLNAARTLRAFDFKPADRRIVRGADFYLEQDGQWLGSWTPWYPTSSLPDQSGYVLPAGSKIVVDLYLRSADVPIEATGTLGLYWGAAQVGAAAGALQVATTPSAGRDATGLEKRTGSVTLTRDTTLLAFKPNSLDGLESVAVGARRPDGRVQMLLLVRDPLPEWPTPYVLKKPLPFPAGTELFVTERYRPDATAAAAGVTVQTLGGAVSGVNNPLQARH
jgi:hypothetical protein